MKLFKKIAAGCLLSLGFICLLGTVFNVVEQDTTQEDRDAAFAGLVLGLPLTISGGWLIWSLSQQHQQQQETYFRSKFFHLIEKGDGLMTVLNFAMEANISGEEAKQYLEKYAQEFGADFEVTEQGGIIYKFAFLKAENKKQELPVGKISDLDRHN